MTVHLVTFHDHNMTRSARLCTESADRTGVSECGVWTPESASGLAVAKQHPEIFTQPANPKRAWAHWAFKPAIVLEELQRTNRINPARYLIYADAGIEFIGDVKEIIDRMDQDIFLFGNNWEHAHWCKRDIVEAIWPLPDGVADAISRTLYLQRREVADELLSWQRFGKQCQASVIFFRVSDYSRRFLKEWLDWCLFEGGRLIDDSPSRTPNHPEFQENRHDQAILTTLAYREGIKLHYWPASYNDGAFVYEKIAEYAGDTYPILFNHHRRRDHEWAAHSLGNLTNSLSVFNDAINKANSA